MTLDCLDKAEHYENKSKCTKNVLILKNKPNCFGLWVFCNMIPGKEILSCITESFIPAASVGCYVPGIRLGAPS